MAKLETVYADSVMESRRRKSNAVPLPYLIRPRRIMPPFDTFVFYNDYSSDDESDEDDSLLEAVETSFLNKGKCFGLGNESNASLSEMGHSMNDEKDEEYVVVDNVEALPNSKTEKAGAIQMMELSKDTVAESDSDDAGSNSDDWVVV